MPGVALHEQQRCQVRGAGSALQSALLSQRFCGRTTVCWHTGLAHTTSDSAWATPAHEATAAALIAERQKLWPTSDCASTSGHSALRVIHGLSTNLTNFFWRTHYRLLARWSCASDRRFSEQHQHAQSRRCRTHCREAEAPAHLFDADCGSHTTPSGPHSAYVRCEGSHTYFLAIALPLLCKPALRIRPQIQHG
jgi:hypothetical protein